MPKRKYSSSLTLNDTAKEKSDQKSQKICSIKPNRKSIFLDHLTQMDPVELDEKQRNELISYQLSPAELELIVVHYETKLGIKIFINGQTPYSEKITEKKPDIETSLSLNDDKKETYAEFLRTNWNLSSTDRAKKFQTPYYTDGDISLYLKAEFPSQYPEIEKLLKKFMDNKNLFIRKLLISYSTILKFLCTVGAKTA